MIKKIVLLFLQLILVTQIVAQQDTIVITDYSDLLVQIDENGKLLSVSASSNLNDAGFFLDGESGMLRICNSDQTSIWVNGRLVEIVENCDYIEIDRLRDLSTDDPMFVSLSSKGSLENLRCEHVVFEELKVIQEEVAFVRDVNDAENEFIILGFVSLVLLFGFTLARHPARSSHIMQKSLTFKLSAYEFVNTSFLSEASLYFFGLFSFTASFVLFYLELQFDYGFVPDDLSLGFLLLEWVKISVALFLLFVTKYAFVSLIAKLFNFKGLKDYQLFDFINFHTLLFAGVILLISFDYLFIESVALLASGFLWIFPSVLILYILWFTLKFVNNSPRRKLMIISYLCATEIVPVVILLGYFFK